MPSTVPAAQAFLSSSTPEALGLSAARLTKLGDQLKSQIEQGRLPGAVALIAREGQIGYFQCFGEKDPVTKSPMEKDSLFRIYSMTKPIVSLAAMMLWEEGKFLLDDPIGKYLPELAKLSVAQASAGKITLTPAQHAITIQDLLRHTAGFTYEFRGSGPIHKKYMEAKIYSRGQSNAEFVTTLSTLPLLHEPGTRWEYSRATDVLGRLVEVLSGKTLGQYLQDHIFAPLGMTDTAFFVPQDKLERLAEAYPVDPDSGGKVQLLNVADAPRFESAGGGLVSTASDYARFLQMLLSQGRYGDTRLVSRKTLELMTADHLGSIRGEEDLLVPGYGFGLGFAVRLQAGIAQMPGSIGQYYWGGLAGTTFWVDPAESLFAILLIQAPGQREYFRLMFRDMVYAAIDD